MAAFHLPRFHPSRLDLAPLHGPLLLLMLDPLSHALLQVTRLRLLAMLADPVLLRAQSLLRAGVVLLTVADLRTVLTYLPFASLSQSAGVAVLLGDGPWS